MTAVSPRTNEPGVPSLPSMTEVEPATKDIPQGVEPAVASIFASIDFFVHPSNYSDVEQATENCANIIATTLEELAGSNCSDLTPERKAAILAFEYKGENPKLMLLVDLVHKMASLFAPENSADVVKSQMTQLRMHFSEVHEKV